MSGLIDLIPDNTEKNKEELAKKLDKTRHKVFKPIRKNHFSRVGKEDYSSLARFIVLEDQIDKKLYRKKKRKPFRKKKWSDFNKDLKLARMAQRRVEEEKRELAKNGVIVFDGGFKKTTGSFYQGRKRSKEWNDTIAFSRYSNVKKKKKRGILV